MAGGSLSIPVTLEPATTSPPSDCKCWISAVGNALGAAAGHLPAGHVAHRAQRQANAGGERAIEREHAVRGDTGK